jgi:hypothetical protein
LADPHASLGASHNQSRRLVPTDTDVRLRWHGERAVVESVRAGSAAAAAGLGLGLGFEVLRVDRRPVAEAASDDEPRHWQCP